MYRKNLDIYFAFKNKHKTETTSCTHTPQIHPCTVSFWLDTFICHGFCRSTNCMPELKQSVAWLGWYTSFRQQKDYTAFTSFRNDGSECQQLIWIVNVIMHIPASSIQTLIKYSKKELWYLLRNALRPQTQGSWLELALDLAIPEFERNSSFSQYNNKCNACIVADS